MKPLFAFLAAVILLALCRACLTESKRRLIVDGIED